MTSVRPAALGAFIGILSFPVMLVVLNIVQAAHYSALTQPGSQLALGDRGRLLDLAFLALAVATLLLGFVLGRTLDDFGAVPVILLLVAGVVGFVPAAFHTDPTGAKVSGHGLLHNMAGLITFILYVATMVTAARRFESSAYWRPLAQASRRWGLGGIAAFVLMIVLAGAGRFGLGERIALAVFLSWMLVTSWYAATALPAVEPVAPRAASPV